MLLPRKMKFIELTVFKNDMDAVLEYLGKSAVMQFSEPQSTADNAAVAEIRDKIERIHDAAEFIGGKIGIDYYEDDEENIVLPGKEEIDLTENLCSTIENLKEIEHKTIQEKQRIRETITEARAFSKMNVPFSDFDHLSYLTLRLGRLEMKEIQTLRENLGERAVIIPLGDGNRILAASSKKGRFALDTQLKKVSFEPISIPENYRGVPVDMLKSLNEQYQNLEKELDKIKADKEKMAQEYTGDLERLVSSWHNALIIEGIKSRFTSTNTLYHFSGWTPLDTEAKLVKDLSALTDGRIAVHSYTPDEVPSIQSGKEKVPVAMKHNSFVKGFESVVFSYGAPLYGTIDPTPIVAFFFTLMFGIMFGDVGQGFVLLLAGILLNKIPSFLPKFKKFSTPLISVGIASMIMGFLAGSVFANEKLLVVPTRAITSFLFGKPMDHILHILPMAGEGGSITKLLYFFGFTISIGIVINSLGLLINIYNRCVLKKYQAAFFSKTGLAGLVFFWYAIFIGLRLIFGGKFEGYDIACLTVPVLCIFFGPIIWKLISRQKPVIEFGIFTFIMEGFVEVMETISNYLSNTISFLRVGAFALAHAVFSFIIFYFTDELARSGIAGTFSAVLISIIGNTIIIVLEGLIVAIQVVRLQYYEFFNKFFIETGVEFAPFRFKSKNI
ncbi:MAG: V-type ATP synthase subunit I [Treponema sp.]|nr:V-type ATP synthase subunit I [Treponema sp.]MCL2251551.1 V-type ATP synthase subunit I [Treponema sp.]